MAELLVLTAGDKQLERVFQAVKQGHLVPKGLNLSYLKEVVENQFFNIFYALAPAGEVGTVFCFTKGKNADLLDLWKKGPHWQSLLDGLVSDFGGRLVCGMENFDYPDRKNWHKIDRSLEMVFDLKNREYFSYKEGKNFPRDKHSGRVADLLSKTYSSSRLGVEVARVVTENPDAVTKVLYQERKIIALAHASLGAEAAFLSLFYVDPHYGKGGFEEKVLSSLCWEVYNRGKKKLYAPVNQKEHRKIGLYDQLGADYTDYSKYLFAVVQDKQER
jgi:hypothetical protein